MPAGYLKDHVILVTNDLNPDAARVPIAVEGLVLAPLSVKPAFFSVGAVKLSGDRDEEPGDPGKSALSDPQRRRAGRAIPGQASQRLGRGAELWR